MFDRARVLFVCAVAGAAAVLSAPVASAAPVVLDDFETDEGHFSFSPTQSGSNRSLSAATAVRSPDVGHTGTASELLTLTPDGAAANPFRIRFLSGNPGAAGNGGTPAQNVPFAPDGFVGYFIRTTTEGLTASIILDDGTTHEKAPVQPIIADGQFHLYEFDLDATNFARFAGTGGTPGLDADTVTIDSIMIEGPQSTAGPFDVYIDTVAYNNEGDLSSLVPEPSAVALLGIGAVGLLARRRRMA